MLQSCSNWARIIAQYRQAMAQHSGTDVADFLATADVFIRVAAQMPFDVMSLDILAAKVAERGIASPLRPEIVSWALRNQMQLADN